MLRILILDDHADIRRLVRWSLKDLAGEIDWHEAHTADDALEMAQRIVPTVALLDIMTPGVLNSLQVCKIIRDDIALAGCRVLLLSARRKATDVQAAMDSGAHAYMVKPFSPENLLGKVRALLAASPTPLSQAA